MSLEQTALVMKWALRAGEWNRLADLATDPAVARACINHAAMAQRMVEFWSKKK